MLSSDEEAAVEPHNLFKEDDEMVVDREFDKSLLTAGQRELSILLQKRVVDEHKLAVNIMDAIRKLEVKKEVVK